MIWDREWRQAWRPAVALTAGTTVRGNRRPGAQKDAVTRSRKESSVSVFLESSLLRIFYIRFFLSPKINEVSISLYQNRLRRAFFPYHNWGTSKDRGGALSSHFSITVPKHSRFDVHSLSLSKGYELHALHSVLELHQA